MNSLKQYIELYLENRGTVDENSAAPLNKLRAEALEVLESAQLPDSSCEDFEHTSINDMFAPDYGVNISRVNIPVDVASSFKCGVPNMSTLLGITVNDSFRSTSTLQGKLTDGALFMSLRAAAREKAELVERYYGSVAPLSNASVALNTLLVQDGALIYVPRGVQLSKPLQLVNIFSSPAPLAAFRRLLIVLEDDAAAQLLVCDHTQDSATDYLSSQVVEVVAGRNSSLEIIDIEESSSRTSRYSQMFVRQHDGSNVRINGTTLYGGITRNDYHIDVSGAHCSTTLNGMAICSASQHTDNHTRINHLSQHCHSTQMFKYVLDDDSKGVFSGSILVAPGASFTEAYQSNRNILASTDARMHTKPQLEIYNDDVKCSHGATTGQLDAEALFYMRTRGITEHEARTMLMQAFMTDVIDSVHIDGLSDRLRHLVELRFKGGPDALCGDCAASCRGESVVKQ